MAHLLLVDDDIALNHVLGEALRLQLGDDGVEVHAASTWEDAQRLAAGLDRLDVLIVDVHLGAHTGLALCESLRARFPELRTLFYTGKASATIEAEAAALGNARVLWKPLPLQRIAAEVRACLAEATREGPAG